MLWLHSHLSSCLLATAATAGHLQPIQSELSQTFEENGFYMYVGTDSRFCHPVLMRQRNIPREHLSQVLEDDYWYFWPASQFYLLQPLICNTLTNYLGPILYIYSFASDAYFKYLHVCMKMISISLYTKPDFHAL